jgi:hypothetical protein
MLYRKITSYIEDYLKSDNRKQGEVDYLVDNYQTMSAHPIEVKSGKDYTVHSAFLVTFRSFVAILFGRLWRFRSVVCEFFASFPG